MSLSVQIYQERFVLLFLKHVKTTTATNLTYQTRGSTKNVLLNSLASLKYKHLQHHECILTKVSLQPQLPHDAVCYIAVYRHVTGWM